MFFNKSNCPCIPADVPQALQKEFCKNYSTITKNKNRLFVFAYDQKMEHLNADFYGPNIHPDVMHPEHAFSIAHHGSVGALATHLGLIARYGKKYPDIPYIAKLSGKTDAPSSDMQDPLSKQLWTVQDVLALKDESKINICGVGATIYLGSEFEAEMLAQAAQIITQAHHHGLVTLLWVYFRGKNIAHETDGLLTSGATGLGATLGADFVKIKPPSSDEHKTSTQWLSVAAAAAGNTKIICAGGPHEAPEKFLTTLHEQIHKGSTSGCATGRNIFQYSLPASIAMTQAIAAIVYKDKSVLEAMKIYKEKQ